MIKVYFLTVERIDNTDKIKGTEYIHNAILECTEKPDVRKLIMDTTSDEDTTLTDLAIEARDPIPEEVTAFEALPAPPEPPRDLAAEVTNLEKRIKQLEIRLGA